MGSEFGFVDPCVIFGMADVISPTYLVSGRREVVGLLFATAI